MKLTLNDCMFRMNQSLNYPSIIYEEVSHFFDQAISELNTSLRISIPSVTEIVRKNTFRVSDQPNLVVLRETPETAKFHHFASASLLPTDGKADGVSINYAYVCSNYWTERSFYKFDGDVWTKYDNLYGIYVNGGSNVAYSAVPVDKSTAMWVKIADNSVTEFDLCEYLPFSWWTLFVLPYVCFKFSVRNGDSGELFREEFVQGFQQLQTSYSIPNTVPLATVVGKPAYSNYIITNSNISERVPTQAVYESMRIVDSILPIYGGFYETGGWGI